MLLNTFLKDLIKNTYLNIYLKYQSIKTRYNLIAIIEISYIKHKIITIRITIILMYIKDNIYFMMNPIRFIVRS